MYYTVSYIARLYITVLETGDKQKGFCRNGINSKASKGTPDTLRGFFTFKGYSFNRSFLYRLRVDKRIEQRKQALLAPATCTMINNVALRNGTVTGNYLGKLVNPWRQINGLYKRVMAFFASCEHFRYSKRFDCWNENKSILTSHMGGGLGHGERCNNVQN